MKRLGAVLLADVAKLHQLARRLLDASFRPPELFELLLSLEAKSLLSKESKATFICGRVANNLVKSEEFQLTPFACLFKHTLAVAGFFVKNANSPMKTPGPTFNVFSPLFIDAVPLRMKNILSGTSPQVVIVSSFSASNQVAIFISFLNSPGERV